MKGQLKAFRGQSHSMARSAASLFRLKPPCLCQGLKRPCRIKWQISVHLAFLPTPAADVLFLMTMSASWGLM